MFKGSEQEGREKMGGRQEEENPLKGATGRESETATAGECAKHERTSKNPRIISLSRRGRKGLLKPCTYQDDAKTLFLIAV